MSEIITLVVIGLFGLFIIMLLLFVTRYKRCPSDKILVIYGKTGSGSAKCVAGGAAFVWPVIQDYAYLDLTPISIDVDLKNALSKQNIRVNVPSRFTVAVSNQEGTMINAAERLLGKTLSEIRDITQDILFGQLRLVVATMDIEDINADRDKFLTNISINVDSELKKIGLTLINVNVTDIKDESGYIEALGEEAAAHAINEAKVRVAERVREGAIGESTAKTDQRIKVASLNAQAVSGEAEASRQQRIELAKADSLAVDGENQAMIIIAESEALRKEKEAEFIRRQRIELARANSLAVDGENQAKITIAESDAIRREKEAEFNRRAVTAEKIAVAKAMEEAYAAEVESENARAKKELATKEANEIVTAEIEKRKIEIDAEAKAEENRRLAKGEADAILYKMQAEAKGLYEILEKQALGFDQIVKATNGNTKDAVLMIIADKLENLVKTQVEAIKNIKIDKITVWEGGNNGKDSSSTSNFISGLYKSVPPMKDLFDMAGMDLPDYLGKQQVEQNKAQQLNTTNQIEEIEGEEA